MRARLCRLTILALALAAGGSGSCAAAAETDATWKAREFTFDYSGFTTRYSCEGLRSKVEQALIALGASKDLTVTPFPCNTRRVERFPSVQIKMSTLEPAAGADVPGAIKTQWKTVKLAGINRLGTGDCELAEQIQHDILPLFVTRNVNAHLNCIPFQESAGNIVLTVDVLVPVAPAGEPQPESKRVVARPD